MLGGFLALLSAATFAFETATARRGVLTGSVAQALSITVPLGVPIFFLVAAAFGALGTVLGFSAEAFAYLALAGVLHFVWGRYCNYRASKAMGANLVAPVQQGNLLVTLALAIWILGEHLTPLRVLGIGLVVLGPALTYDRTSRKVASTEPADTKARTPSRARRSKPKRARCSSRTTRRAICSRSCPRPATASARCWCGWRSRTGASRQASAAA